MLKLTVFTNNESVVRDKSHEVQFIEGDAFAVLRAVRDAIHLGGILKSYPLGASIKMLHAPIVSVLVEEKKGPVDQASFEVIEDSIIRLQNVMGERPFDWRNRKDYELVDNDRLHAALSELNAFA